MNVTLDTNCLIALENAEPAASAVRELIELHQGGRVHLCVSAIAASEAKASGEDRWPPFSRFRDRLAAVGLSEVEILRPMCYWGIAYLDHCWQFRDEHLALERKIHEVLFQTLEFSYEEYCKRVEIPHTPTAPARAWLNAKCDVQSLWSHIHSGGEIFVTSDSNFHKATKRRRLISLGARNIATPEAILGQLPA